MSDLREMLSMNLLLPLWHLQRLARPSRRAIALSIREGLRFRRKAEAWSAEQKREWIINRLRYVARKAYSETAHYKDLFDRIGFDPLSDFTFDDFSRLPALEREHAQKAGRNLISQAIPANQLKKDATGGSTGTPTEIWIGPEEMGWKESCGEYYMQRLGVPTGKRTALLWGHHLDPGAASSLRERYHEFETNSRWFDCMRLSPETLDRYHHEFQRMRPACIVAYASAAGHLAEHILERGYSPDYPTRCFVTGAEKLLPDHREKIERAFGRPVYERYGARDVGYMAFQVGSHGQTGSQYRVGFHGALDYEVDWANLLVEPETDKPDSSILITKLHADGMPMLRYRIGDVGLFPEGSNPGHPVFRLRDIIGRDTDRIWLPDGRWISGTQIPHMMKDHPVREYMFAQRSDYSIEIKIVPKNEFEERSRRSIIDTVSANLPGLAITTVLVDEIPRTKSNKWRAVVSEVEMAYRKSA
jgi:phenylacetate-coenzyme A ligase PaaK-like adenylate-forming protein